MKLDLRHSLNEGIVRQHSDRPNVLSLSLPRDHPDPYYTLGCHPEVVEFVWDKLGKQIPNDCRAVVFGTPGLVHPVVGVVLALAYGTTYALRVRSASITSAVNAGYTTERVWSTGEQTNIESDLGHGWFFGRFSEKQESQWLIELYSEISEGS